MFTAKLRHLFPDFSQFLLTGNVSTLLNLHQVWGEALPEGQTLGTNDLLTDKGEATPEEADETNIMLDNDAVSDSAETGRVC